MDLVTTLHSILPEDYEMLKGYFKRRKPITCENVITDMYIWKDYYNTRYFVGKFGVVFIYQIGDDIFTTIPLCEEKNIKEAFTEAKEYFNNVLGKKFKIYLADEESVKLLQLSSDKFEIYEERDYFDYVYDAQALRNLSGKKYHKKKNHLNAFKKEYEGRYEAEIVECSNVEEIIEFLHKWHDMRTIDDDYSRDEFELKGIEYVLRNCNMIKCKKMIVRIDGVIEAFTLGTYLSEEKIAYIHVEKANPSIRGLYNFINQQFIEKCFPDSLYVNREDDMGLDGLRQAKMSYNPIELVKKYTIIER